MHIDVRLNMDDVGPRIRRALREQLQPAAANAERQGENVGDRFGRGFERSAVRSGRQAGVTFAGGFAAGFSRRNRAIERTFGERLGRVLGISARGLGIFGLAATGAGVALGGLTLAAAPAINALTGVAVGAVESAGAIALLPAVLSAAAAGVAVLVTAFQGMGDALGAAVTGDAEEFRESLEGLSPSARSVARAFRSLVPALREIREEVQQRFFAGLSDEIESLDQNLLPALRRGMRGLAGAMGDQFEAVFAALGTERVSGQIETFFDNARIAAQRAIPGVASFTESFVRLSEIGSTFLPRFAERFSEIFDEFNQFAQTDQGEVAITDFIERSIEALNQFGRVVRDTFAAFGNVLNIAESSGVGFLDTLESVATAFREFTESEVGQLEIGRIFDSLRRAGEAAAPVFRELFRTFSEISPVLADIAEEVAPGIEDFIRNFGDALQDIGPDLADDLGSVASSLADMVGPVTELLGPLANLTASVLRPLVPVVEILAPLVGDLANAFAFLFDVADDIGLAGLTAAGGAFALLTRRLRRVRRDAASGGEEAGVGFAAGFLSRARTRIGRGLRTLFKGGLIGTLINEIFTVEGQGPLDLAIGGFQTLAAVITGNQEALENLRREFGPAVREIRGFFGGLVEGVEEFFGGGASVNDILRQIGYFDTEAAKRDAAAWFADFQLSLSEGFTGIQETANRDWLNTFRETVEGGFNNANESASLGMQEIADTIAVQSALAGNQASNMQEALDTTVQQAMQDANRSAFTGMQEVGDTLAQQSAAAGARADSMSGPLSSNVSGAMDAARSVASGGMNTLAAVIDVGARDAANQAADLGDHIVDVIGSISLFGAGFSLMESLGSGIAAGGAAAANEARGIAAGIRGLFPSSPAEWGPFSGQGDPEILGRNIADGIADGLRRGRGDVSVAGSQLAGSIFSGSNSRTYGGGGSAFTSSSQSSSTSTGSGTFNAPITINTVGDPDAVAAQVVNRLDSFAARMSL